MRLEERKLSYQARKKMPKGEFVFPKEKRYPIPDKVHARNALARVAQHGSSSEQAKVRSAVHSKYPDIGKDEGLLDLLVPWPPLGEHCGHCPCPKCGHVNKKGVPRCVKCGAKT